MPIIVNIIDKAIAKIDEIYILVYEVYIEFNSLLLDNITNATEKMLLSVDRKPKMVIIIPMTFKSFDCFIDIFPLLNIFIFFFIKFKSFNVACM